MQPRPRLQRRLRLVRAARPRTSSSRTTRSGALGVILKVPVFDGWRTAGKVAQARADRDQGRARTASPSRTRSDLEAQAGRRPPARGQRACCGAAELNVRQAQKALEMIEANYQLGAATILDVIDAQAASTQAESNRVEALLRPRQRPRQAALRDGPRTRSTRLPRPSPAAVPAPRHRRLRHRNETMTTPASSSSPLPSARRLRRRGCERPDPASRRQAHGRPRDARPPSRPATSTTTSC